jgi:hypothetical protein
MPTIEFNKRKPSKAVLMRTIGEYLKQGVTDFDLRWGENWIELSYEPMGRYWHGSGWIGNTGGSDIADELTEIRKQAVKLLRG